MANLAINGGTPVRSKFLIFGAPVIEEDEINEVVDTLRSGWIGTGPKTIEFENKFKEYVGCQHAVATNACTSALHLSLIAAGIDANDEVITTPMTFVATTNVILHQRAKPVFVDILEKNLNINPELIESNISKRTKAILPVHFAGLPCEMDQIMGIAKRNELTVIEDAAHAIGARYKNTMIGNIGDLTSFSFYPNKNITTIEGGMVTTNNKEWAEKIAILRLHGVSKDAWKRYSTPEFQTSLGVLPGYKYNMTDTQASLGLHQLKKIERFLKKREHIVEIYDQEFSQYEEITRIEDTGDFRHARHLYLILLNLEMLKVDRNEFVKAMKAENIGVGIHYVAVHLHPYYSDNFGYRRGDYPNAEYISDRILSLPLSPRMTDDDVHDVIVGVKKVLQYYRR